MCACSTWLMLRQNRVACEKWSSKDTGFALTFGPETSRGRWT